MPLLPRAAGALVFALAALAPGANAQEATCAPAALDVPDPFGFRFDAARLLQLTGGAERTGSLFLRRVSAESGVRVCADSTRFLDWALHEPVPATRAFQWSIVAPSAQLGYNSAYPRDRNNGAVWGGVGSTLAATVGVRARWRWFDLQLAPQFFSEENADFERVPSAITGRSEFGNPYHRGIDWIQRPGTESRSDVDAGQSFIRGTLGPASAGFGTENVWLGANRIYPILMSTTAGGFPHVFLETSRPVQTPIGGLELRATWGKLTESEWFDGNIENDERRIAVLLAAYSPRWIPGFSFGAARVYEELVVPGQSFGPGDWLGIIIDPSFLSAGGGNRAEGNGLAGLFARWALPAAGFEVFGEWTREDTPYNMQDVLGEPDWTQAYALGFQQLIRLRGERAVRWYGELIHLGESAPLRAGRGLFSYYTHSQVVQGHTQRGQLLGAWTGPGSDAQTLGADFLYPRGLTGLWVERNRYDDDTYYRRFADTYAETRHDAEFSVGVRQLYAVAGVELEASALYGLRYNRNFLGLDGSWEDARKDNNFNFNIRAQWFPRFARWQSF